MEFEINNNKWTIEEVNDGEMKLQADSNYTLGLTIYKTQKILLLNTQANIISTLKHELCHTWLYEYGHPQNENETFTYEDLCNIVASSNNFINEIVNKYIQNKRQ